jgi:RimJ/RimL family protein N-acetyltransferase
MNISLQTRTRDHVKTFWEKTQDKKIQSMFPTSISSLEEALALFENSLQNNATSYGKVILVDDIYIGDIWCYGIDVTNEKMAMLSIVIFDKSKWGQGIAATVIPPFLDEVFHRYPIHSIGAFTYASNQRSLRALQKSGFQSLETFREDGIKSIYLEYKKG